MDKEERQDIRNIIMDESENLLLSFEAIRDMVIRAGEGAERAGLIASQLMISDSINSLTSAYRGHLRGEREIIPGFEKSA